MFLVTMFSEKCLHRSVYKREKGFTASNLTPAHSLVGVAMPGLSKKFFKLFVAEEALCWHRFSVKSIKCSPPLMAIMCVVNETK